VSLCEANQSFARCIRAVERGAEFVITRRGHPIARLVRVATPIRNLSAHQKAARRRALAIM